METRIYIVRSRGVDPTPTRLVEAASAAQAVRHVVKSQYHVEACTPKVIASVMSSGVMVEDANGAAVENHNATTAP